MSIYTHIDNDARAHPEVLSMDLSHGMSHKVSYNIEGDDKAKVWDNKQFTKCLYANRPFPLLEICVRNNPSPVSRFFILSFA